MTEPPKSESLKEFAKKVEVDPRTIDVLFWLGFIGALLVLAYAVYRFVKRKKETKKNG